MNEKIVVIGAGVMGTSVAFHLAKAGFTDVTVVDKGAIASGTTPQAAGQTAHLTSHRSALPFAVYCTDFFDNFEARTGYAIDLKQSGSLRVAMGDRFSRNLEGYIAAAQEMHDDRVYMISAEKAQKLAPLLHLPQKPAGILYNGGDAYVEPRSVALAYAAGARDLGVKFMTHTKVLGFETSGAQISGVKTNRGVLPADKVALAAGAWSRKIARHLDIDVQSVPVRHQLYVTAPMANVDPSIPIVRIIDPQIYLRPESGGLLLGGYGYRPNSYEMDDFGPNFEIGMLPNDFVANAEMRQAALPYFPILKDAVIAREQRGLPTVTPDGGLIIQESKALQGLVVVSGCQVAGVAYSPAIGKISADIIAGEECDLIADKEFSMTRFDPMYRDDALLRARTEHIYGTMYWGSSAYSHLETDEPHG